MEITELFVRRFRPDSLEAFDDDPSVIYGLNDELQLGLLNDAWFESAHAANASREFFENYGLGGSYVDAIAAPLRAFFEYRIRRSIDKGETWTFDYQCPKPNQFSMYRMQVLPLGAQDGAQDRGCLVTNASIIEIPRPEDDLVATEDVLSIYVRDDGFVTQCAHCRQTRRVDKRSRWDWVPQLVWEELVPVSHGLCATCFAYFHSTPEA